MLRANRHPVSERPSRRSARDVASIGLEAGFGLCPNRSWFAIAAVGDGRCGRPAGFRHDRQLGWFAVEWISGRARGIVRRERHDRTVGFRQGKLCLVGGDRPRAEAKLRRVDLGQRRHGNRAQSAARRELQPGEFKRVVGMPGGRHAADRGRRGNIAGHGNAPCNPRQSGMVDDVGQRQFRVGCLAVEGGAERHFDGEGVFRIVAAQLARAFCKPDLLGPLSLRRRKGRANCQRLQRGCGAKGPSCQP